MILTRRTKATIKMSEFDFIHLFYVMCARACVCVCGSGEDMVWDEWALERQLSLKLVVKIKVKTIKDCQQ